jgi:2,5-diketo-D-gluconate reductase A
MPTTSALQNSGHGVVPSIVLNNGVCVPQLGFGVFQIPADSAQAAVETALELGYRHIDTAAAYNNEAAVGAGIRASGIPRDKIFVTTKLRNGNQGYEGALDAFAASNRALGVDYIDLYLIHWPSPKRDLYVSSWHALERLYGEKSVRAIGVSNFLPEHLDRLLAAADVVPAVNQLEIHPTFQQNDVAQYSRSHGMEIEAYSPLGQGNDLDSAIVCRLAERYGMSRAAIILRWHLQRGNIVFPKSTNLERMRANIDVFGFDLAAEDEEQISSLDTDIRIGTSPRDFEITQIR